MFLHTVPLELKHVKTHIWGGNFIPPLYPYEGVEGDHQINNVIKFFRDRYIVATWLAFRGAQGNRGNRWQNHGGRKMDRAGNLGMPKILLLFHSYKLSHSLHCLCSISATVTQDFSLACLPSSSSSTIVVLIEYSYLLELQDQQMSISIKCYLILGRYFHECQIQPNYYMDSWLKFLLTNW